MTLGEKLSKLRKENNYTQEQLAEILEVSRQAISKWESDVAYPETEKLIRLGKLFDCSMDYLLKEECTDKSGREGSSEVISLMKRIPSALKRQCRERKSQKTVCGMPLYHIGRKARGFFAVGVDAKGIIVIGVKARGILSLGFLSFGVLSLGLLSLGLLSLGVFSFGLLAVGSVAAGIFSVGAVSLGIVSLGALSIGEFSVGAFAVGKYIAVGDHARAMIAIGETEAAGSLYQKLGALTPSEISQVKELLDANVPSYLGWAKELIRIFVS